MVFFVFLEKATVNVVEGWTMTIERNENNHFLIDSLGVSRYNSFSLLLLYGRVYLTPGRESWLDERPVAVGRRIHLTAKNTVRMVSPKKDKVGFSVKYEKVCGKFFFLFLFCRLEKFFFDLRK